MQGVLADDMGEMGAVLADQMGDTDDELRAYAPLDGFDEDAAE
jgi:hypothetical protein